MKGWMDEGVMGAAGSKLAQQVFSAEISKLIRGREYPGTLANAPPLVIMLP